MNAILEGLLLALFAFILQWVVLLLVVEIKTGNRK